MNRDLTQIWWFTVGQDLGQEDPPRNLSSSFPPFPKRSAFLFLSLVIVMDFIQLFQPSKHGTIVGQRSSGSWGAGTIVDAVSFPSHAARHPFPFHIPPSPGSLTSLLGVFQAVDLLFHRRAAKENARLQVTAWCNAPVVQNVFRFG